MAKHKEITDRETQNIHETLRSLTQDIDYLPEKDFLIPSLQSHTRHIYYRLNPDGVNQTVQEWFDNLPE